jgi:catechol 2,3-dioxygenase-like lactoylglutathione lyase family enzyme
MQRAVRRIDPNLRVGHVRLRTADIDRVRDFYVGILGFDVVDEARDVPGWGTTGAQRSSVGPLLPRTDVDERVLGSREPSRYLQRLDQLVHVAEELGEL